MRTVGTAIFTGTVLALCSCHTFTEPPIGTGFTRVEVVGDHIRLEWESEGYVDWVTLTRYCYVNGRSKAPVYEWERRFPMKEIYGTHDDRYDLKEGYWYRYWISNDFVGSLGEGADVFFEKAPVVVVTTPAAAEEETPAPAEPPAPE